MNVSLTESAVFPVEPPMLDDEPSHSLKDTGPPRLQAALGRKPRVVVVDDDPKFCHLLEYVGLQQGIIVTPYCTVEEIELPVLTNADVIVVDYNLGGRTGVEISRELKRKGIRTPLLLVSASQDVFKEESWGDNICGFTSKELGPFGILDSIVQVISERC